ncbi:hypothetical protein DM794_16790 [Paenarthrobacter ureafaciens]|nr:hypothetical protein [Paenarthrobacter ureafaciens]
MTSFRNKSLAECSFPRHVLLRRWQTASYKRGWRFRADWLLPEVRTVVKSLATCYSVPPMTARSLGAARARNGVGISETMADFRALFVAADQTLDIDALQSLAEGWAEVAETVPPISCTDVYTGLATPAHFQRRIHEVSVATPGSGPHALAVIHLPEPQGGRSHCWTLLALLGDTVQAELKGTGATAMYQDFSVHVLLPLSAFSLGRLLNCKIAVESLGEGVLSPAKVKFLPFSVDPGTAGAWKSRPESN